jgi:hypothetical protein
VPPASPPSRVGSAVARGGGSRHQLRKVKTAQNRPDIIPELKIGAEHNGRYYCWGHLPEDSEWLNSMPKFGELPPPV